MPAGGASLCYDRKLTQQFGGYLQGQYWFTNQWYHDRHLELYPGLRHRPGHHRRCWPAMPAANPAGYKYASNNDQVKLWSEYNLTLWYRPIEALKFGLTYAYETTYYLQKLNNPQ